LRELELEEQDRRGYAAQPHREEEFRAWGMPPHGRKTRERAIGHLSTVTVAPITSTIRGMPSEVILDVDDGMKGHCAVNLHNAVTVAQSRVGRRVGSLGAGRMPEVCPALRFSLGCG
jgi:mRNA interferase MazF